MKLVIRAAGLMRRGPERDMTDDYLSRAAQLARGCGFLGVEERAIETRKLTDKTAITQALIDGVPEGAQLLVLDERGKTPTTRQMARQLSGWRDNGVPETVFLIGAADGLDLSALPPGRVSWALGPQTWPHRLVRVMIAEQIYRSLSILAGTPYHRD